MISCAVLLCSLSADGDNAVLTPPVIKALSAIDSIPSQAALNDAFASQRPVDSLLAIALDQTGDIDIGIALRATRALPSYCPPCGPGTTIHDGLFSLIDRYQPLHTPQDLMRLRAAIEALGATRSQLLEDVDKLTQAPPARPTDAPLLEHNSRDVRVTVVHALRDICNMEAIGPLKVHNAMEPIAQVKFAITAAILDLGQCAPH